MKWNMKTVLVTGATDGIGRETARQLLEKGFRVLIHGRTADRAVRTVDELALAVSDARLEAVYGDLADMRQVVELADHVRARSPELDVLINNAGVYEERRVISRDGFEMTMAVNHFAHFLLTLKLLECLKAAPQGRVITVSSIAHSMGTLNLDDLTFERGYSGYDAYAVSKIANILFTVALAGHLAGTKVTANCLHPGVISTKLLHKGFGLGGDPVAEGAKTPVYLAISDEVRDVSGAYFIDCARAVPSRQARDEKLAAALWRKSEELLRPFLGG